MKKTIAWLVTGLTVCTALTGPVALASSVTPESKVSNHSKGLKEIFGSFTGNLNEGGGNTIVDLGTVENFSPNFIILDVINGGPASLDWSAAIYDTTTNSLVGDWTPFVHGYSALDVRVSGTNVGDHLELWLHANSGSGEVSLTASAG